MSLWNRSRSELLSPFREWAPFKLAENQAFGAPTRPIETLDGVGDRLRSAAFAEIQAREAFLWACVRFEDAPVALKEEWQTLAIAEHKHLGWLLTRLNELGFTAAERTVSDFLWKSFHQCEDARSFSLFMSSAEERGRKAGHRFHEFLAEKDPKTAEIFRAIAVEELEHVQLAEKFFPGQIEAYLEAQRQKQIEKKTRDRERRGVNSSGDVPSPTA